MPQSDLPIEQLRSYRSHTRAPADLADFWAGTLEESRRIGSPPVVHRLSTGLRLIDTDDVTFSGFDGHPIKAWFHRPAGQAQRLPVVVRYQGYGCGRAAAHEVPVWTLAGYACLDVDTRGQGATYSTGDTPDPVGSDPSVPGFLTRGIRSRNTYYYRRVITDSVLAVDAAKLLPGVDATRVAVAGASQGGGLAVAVAGLRDDLVAVVSDVPFLSDLRRASEIASRRPYTELSTYLSIHRADVARVFDTLAYFDAAVLGRSAAAPAIFSVGLMDQVCPPSTVYAAYNAYAGPKQIEEYPYNDHEGGAAHHQAVTLAWLNKIMAA